MRKIKIDEIVSFGSRERVIEGTVCAITDLEELGELPDDLPGTILALPKLFWNDWFAKLAALGRFNAVLANTDTSMLCHGAIMLRELGFVCVTVPDLFEKIKNGDRVRIRIKKSGWCEILRDLIHNIRWGKNLLNYPRGMSHTSAELVVLD